jgi:hypothetical protein
VKTQQRPIRFLIAAACAATLLTFAQPVQAQGPTATLGGRVDDDSDSSSGYGLNCMSVSDQSITT